MTIEIPYFNKALSCCNSNVERGVTTFVYIPDTVFRYTSCTRAPTNRIFARVGIARELNLHTLQQYTDNKSKYVKRKQLFTLLTQILLTLYYLILAVSNVCLFLSLTPSSIVFISFLRKQFKFQCS